VTETNKPHVLFSRFDFSHNGVIDAQKLGDVEGMCRQAVQQEQHVYSKEVSLKEAQKINGMPVLTPGLSDDHYHVLLPSLLLLFITSLCQALHCQKVHSHLIIANIIVACFSACS
jgi:alanyl-tRNA synthetase